MAFFQVDVTKPVKALDRTTDWTKCLLCQKVTSEKLTCPANSKRESKTEGYEVLADKLVEFAKVGGLPFELDLEKMAGECGLLQSFVKYQASWHKSCYSFCSSSRLERAKKRRSKQDNDERNEEHVSPPKTRKCDVSISTIEICCMFCSKAAGTDNLGPLCKVLTQETSTYIKDSASYLRDGPLMAKCAGTFDLMADDSAVYHKNCLTLFRNKVRAKETERAKGRVVSLDSIHGFAFADLVSYIEDTRKTSVEAPIFKLADLAKRYDSCMASMGVENKCYSSRLKDKLLETCPFLEATGSMGKDVFISYKSDVYLALRSLASRTPDDGNLDTAAKFLRNAIFNHVPCSWADMSEDTQKKSVPMELLKFVKICLDGPKSLAENSEDAEIEQEVLSISQLIYYHASKRRKGKQRRHDSKKETPVPVYMAMKLYGSTRKKELVDITFKNGLGLSYDRVQAHLNETANAVCALARAEGVVCPVSLRKGVFTTAAVDNVDHNTSSTTATGSFHGTAISLVQHPDFSDQGTVRTLNCSADSGQSKEITQLPEDYAIVLPCFLNAKNATCTVSGDYVFDDLKTSNEVLYEQEAEWLEKCLKSEECMPWSAHHAQQERSEGRRRTQANIAVLPVFKEQANTMAMMKHAMNVTKKAVDLLNPGQTVVLTADQPLFALLKQIQFSQPDSHGKEKFFIMFGGLHIEKWAFSTLGDWLMDSGWTDAITEAEITSAGRADSMLHASHIRRTRYTHEVTVAALHRLQCRAYDAFVEEYEGTAVSFQDWRNGKCSTIPQFKYWDTTLNFELAALQFVRSLRTADFTLYIKSLNLLVPWFFALDHVHYARWLSVHVRDLVCLPFTNPDLAESFQAGKFVVNKTVRPFSSIALDQAHEQVNAELKGDGGMIGLTEDPDALLKWMLSAPEIARIVNQFEQNLHLDDSDQYNTHHSETASSEASFRRHVDSLVEVFEGKGNPFLESGEDLYSIETQKVAPKEVVQTVFNIEERGKSQYLKFVEERLKTGTVKLMDPIKQNKYPLFKFTPAKKQTSKTSAKLADAKEDSGLFSRLYIACHTRKGDPAEFFKHENHLSPPAFAIRGEMRTTRKSALLPCLTKDSICTTRLAPPVTAKLIDGAAMVNMIRPGTSRNFAEYANVFSNYVKGELFDSLRVDIVWDSYLDDSLKNNTRQNRGEGTRTRVFLTTKVPKGWPNFLRLSKNKVELFALLTDQVCSLVTPNKEVYATSGEMVKTNNLSRSDLTAIQPCSHEEADTRLMLHAADAARDGHSRIMIRTVDTDVVVLAIASFVQIDELDELWISLGSGKSHQYIAVHEIANTMGPDKSRALPAFHAYTGCDTIESFFNHGKPSAFAAWTAYPEVTEAFLAMGTPNYEEKAHLLENFVLFMYDRTTTYDSVNECRLQLFTARGRQMENIPPTEDALGLHGRRAAFQGGFVWAQCLQKQPQVPSPAEWGWLWAEDEWKIVWITLPTAASSCIELKSCRCKGKCIPSRCICLRNNLKCTLHCKSCQCIRGSNTE